jgi:serine/threonine-protein kinase
LAGTAVIEVTAGPGQGQTVRLELGESAVIGRGADVRIKIDDPAVSRRHIAIEHRAEGILVRDLGSKHGAVLDGRRIPRDGAIVALAATLHLGESRIDISRAGSVSLPELPGLRIEEKLGEGASGLVFAAWQDPPGRRVALKSLASGADEVTRKRFGREAELAGRLDHPAIVRILGLVSSGDRLYLIRELVAGPSLEEVAAKGALPVPRALEIGAKVAEALAHAHERGVVHRDVRPGNVFLDGATGEPRLADFDLARDARARPTLAEVTQLTKTGDHLGAWSYIAPEQYENARQASSKVDVYGLGGTLYFALSGESPFQRTLPDRYLQDLLGPGPPALAEILPGFSAPVSALVARALATDPRARPDAAELARALSALIARR